MFDLGWSELLIIGLVTLLVVGPKELPRVLRTVRQVLAKAKAMAREFQSGVDDMIREADVEDMRKEINDLKAQADLKSQLDAVAGPLQELREPEWLTREMAKPASYTPPAEHDEPDPAVPEPAGAHPAPVLPDAEAANRAVDDLSPVDAGHDSSSIAGGAS